MKTMADSLGDLGCPVEDRMLVLNVLRGLSDRYTHLRSLIMCQRPFPTFLQVRDDLALEAITLGAQAASISGPGSSSSSTALAAITRPVHLLCHTLPLALIHPGRAGAVGVEVADAGAVAIAAVVAVVVVVVPAVVPVAPHRRRDPSRVRLGPLFTTRGQGASPCGCSRGQVLRRVPRRPCSLVRSQGSPWPLCRPGPRHLPPCLGPCRRLLHRPGWLVGTRSPWLPSRLPL
jgi:hypothetical protein